MSTDQTGDHPNPKPAGFLAALIWIVGGFAVWWAATTWLAITTYEPIGIPFFGARPYTQCLLFTLWGLGIVLAALHILVHFYRRHAGDGERFPGQLGSLVIPTQFRWMRMLLFAVLVGGSTFSYCYFVGRMFHHLSIIWAEDIGKTRVLTDKEGNATGVPEKPVSEWDNTRSGAKLLQWPLKPGSPFARGWRWYSWHDSQEAYKAVNRNHPTGSTVATTAYPGFEPCLFLLLATGFVISLVLAVARPIPPVNIHNPGI